VAAERDPLSGAVSAASSSSTDAAGDSDSDSDAPGFGGVRSSGGAADKGGLAGSLQRRLAADGSGFEELEGSGFDGCGFESAFDDDFEPTRYCVNCTGALDSDLCMVRVHPQ